MRSHIIVSLIILTAASSPADTPTTRPDEVIAAPSAGAAPNPRRPLFPRLGAMHGNAERANKELNRDDPPSEEEWQKISVFSQENFPARWKMFQRVQAARGEDNPLIQTLKLRIAGRYRQLQSAREEMPGFYQTALEQGKLEDKALGLVQDLQGDPANDGIHAKLRETVSTLISNVLAERAQRIKRLRKALDEEQNAYDHDSQNVDQLVDTKLKHLIGDGVDFDRFSRPAVAPATEK